MKLLILGTGSMARSHALAFKKERGIDVVAAVETNAERLAAFAKEHDIPNTFPDLDEAIAWGEFEAAGFLGLLPHAVPTAPAAIFPPQARFPSSPASPQLRFGFLKMFACPYNEGQHVCCPFSPSDDTLSNCYFMISTRNMISLPLSKRTWLAAPPQFFSLWRSQASTVLVGSTASSSTCSLMIFPD